MKLSLSRSALVEALLVLGLLSVPIYFTPLVLSLFDPPKATLLKALVLVALGLEAPRLHRATEAWLQTTTPGIIARISSLSVLLRPLHRSSSHPSQSATITSIAAPPQAPQTLSPSSLRVSVSPWCNRLPTLVWGGMVALVGVTLLSALLSITPDASWRGTVERGQGALVFSLTVVFAWLIAGHARTGPAVDRLLNLALAGSIPACLDALSQRIGLDGVNFGCTADRPSSTLGNPIFLAAYLILLVPLTNERLGQAVQSAKCKVQSDSATPSAVSDQRSAVSTQQTALSTQHPAPSPQSSVLSAWHFALRPIPFVLGTALLAWFLAVAGPGAALWWLAPAVLGVWALCLATAARHLAAPPLGRARSTLDSRLSALLWAALLLLQIAAVLVTQSRGPWLGLAAGLVVYFVLRAPRLAFSWRGPLVVAGGAVLAGGLALGTIASTAYSSPCARPAPPQSDVASVDEQARVAVESRMQPARARLALWQSVVPVLTQWPIVSQRPDPVRGARPLLGYGPETQLIVTGHQRTAEIDRYEGPTVVFDRLHNHVLDQVITTGYAGLAAYLFTAGAALLLAMKLARRGPHAGVAAALGGALVAHLVEAQVGLVLTVSGLYFWLLVGLLLAIARVQSAKCKVQSEETFLGESAEPGRRAGGSVGVWLSVGYVVIVVGLVVATWRGVLPEPPFRMGYQLGFALMLLAAVPLAALLRSVPRAQGPGGEVPTLHFALCTPPSPSAPPSSPSPSPSSSPPGSGIRWRRAGWCATRWGCRRRRTGRGCGWRCSRRCRSIRTSRRTAICWRGRTG